VQALKAFVKNSQEEAVLEADILPSAVEPKPTLKTSIEGSR
jgi:hypothetical protein